MSNDPQTQLADDSHDPADPAVGVQATPSPESLIAASRDASQDSAVSAQPTDTEPQDLQDARDRVAWDADTQDGAPCDTEG